MNTQLTIEQKNNIVVVQRYLMAASSVLKLIDTQIQCEGTTGENPINHTAWDLENTANYIGSWSQNGVDL